METLPLKRKAKMVATSLMVACGGCSPQGLEGSLTEIMDLHYRQAEVASTPAQLVVRFARPLGGGEDIVLQVTANLSGAAPGPTRYDLAETISPGTQRGILSRNVFNDPRQTFPAIARGSLQVKGTLATGQSVSGDFSVTFVECTSFACGRTVFGNFGAIVQ